jgi:hypothetical protein
MAQALHGLMSALTVAQRPKEAVMAASSAQASAPVTIALAQDPKADEKGDQAATKTCRRICSGPPENRTCALECTLSSPRAQKPPTLPIAAAATAPEAVATPVASPDPARVQEWDHLQMATLMYLTYLELELGLEEEMYGKLLFCTARFINSLPAQPLHSKEASLAMGVDLEQRYWLHQAEKHCGHRNTATFLSCLHTALTAQDSPAAGMNERERAMLVNDFQRNPLKYQMKLDAQAFMERLEQVPLEVLEAFAQATWRHTLQASILKRHCIGNANPLVVSLVAIQLGEAFALSTGVNMESKIRDMHLPEDQRPARPQECRFEYVVSEEAVSAGPSPLTVNGTVRQCGGDPDGDDGDDTILYVEEHMDPDL